MPHVSRSIVYVRTNYTLKLPISYHTSAYIHSYLTYIYISIIAINPTPKSTIQSLIFMPKPEL